ncbi:MAG: DUF1015 domain-containing protein [Candidatus Lokiarchaeota archaeon]|nr:DUF1015 domain-containing protein [Candidatus Lokiarchaeota archaeon]
MVEISPFRAYHYNSDEIDTFVSKPYDVISEEEKAIYKRNPYNITHLELPTNYNDAAQKLKEWINEKKLIPRDKKSIFIYKMNFSLKGEDFERIALLTLLKLSSFEEKKVLPHEMTFSKCMDDRLNLLRATKANFSPVFMIYRGIDSIKEIISEQIKNNPIYQIKDEDGFLHQVWEINDDKLIQEIIKKFNGVESVIIADGHHRYKTALKYHKKEGKNPYIMAYLVDVDDPGLIILPTHRLIKDSNAITNKVIKEKLSDLFEIKEIIDEDLLFQELERNKDNTSFGFASKKGKLLLLTMKKDINPVEKISTKQSDAWKKLDVTILNEIIIKKKLGIYKNLEFSKNPKKSIKLVKSGIMDAAFILNSTKITEVEEITKMGELMPHKSTYFYPKPLSGILIWIHNN